MDRPSQPSDRQLVAGALGDPRNFAPIVHRYVVPLKRYLARLLGRRPETVEDVLQEVFLKVYVNLLDYDTSRPFSPWIYRIAHNEAISTMRRDRADGLTISGEDGGLLHLLNVGWRTHELLEARLPLYKSWTANAEAGWGTPEQGYLAGAARGFDGNHTHLLVDFEDKTWTVDTLGAELALDEALGSEEDLAIRGTKIGDATFRAQRIRDWDP